MLSYPFAWLPLLTVLAALVLLNAWLVLIAVAIVALLMLAFVGALVWAVAAGLHRLVSRVQREWRSRTGGSEIHEVGYEASSVRSAPSGTGRP